MFYVVSTQVINDKTRYEIYNRITNSIYRVDKEGLKTLQKMGENIISIDYTKDLAINIAEYTVALSKISKNKWLTAAIRKWSIYSKCSYKIQSDKELNESLKYGAVVNGDKEGKIHGLVEYNQELCSKAEKEISNTISKQTMFGKNVNIEYTVVGNEVVLTKYESNSNEIIIPNIITSIGANSIVKDYNKIVLGNKVKYIGTNEYMKDTHKLITNNNSIKINEIKSDNFSKVITGENIPEDALKADIVVSK